MILMSPMDRNSLPPLQTLVAFEASVRLRSFTLAAQELSLTQGAVSQHIRSLEQRLGRRLFERQRQGAAPTREAQHLALQVRQGLGVLERAFKTPRRRHRATTLRLSTLPSIAQRWLLPRLADFPQRFPDIRVEVSTDVDLVKLGGNANSDVALRYGPGGWPGLQSEALSSEWVYPVASPDYRDGKLPRRRADLGHCVLLRHAAQPWALWLQAAGLALANSDQGPLFPNLTSLLAAAENGEGIALARHHLVRDALAAGRLVRLWKTQVIDVHRYYLVWAHQADKDDAIDTLRQWLKTAFTL